MAADAGGVDERQPVLQQRARRGDLDAQHLPAAGLRCAPQVVLHLARRDLDDLGLCAVAAGDDQPGRRLLPVGNHRGKRRGLVVADPGDGDVEQRVEQLALALLELARDHHPDLRIADPLLGHAQPLHQIAAVVSGGDPGAVVDQLDDDLDLAGVIRLRHDVFLLAAALDQR